MADQTDASSLTPLEKAVMDAALAGDHPVLQSLREQLRICKVRKRGLTGVGFFTDFDGGSDASPAPTTKDRLHIGDVHAEVSGLEHGAGFIVFVAGGRLDMLEGFTYGEAWPENIPEFQVRYTMGDERDLSSLEL